MKVNKEIIKVIIIGLAVGLLSATIQARVRYVDDLKETIKEQDRTIESLNYELENYRFEESYNIFCTLEGVTCGE